MKEGQALDVKLLPSEVSKGDGRDADDEEVEAVAIEALDVAVALEELSCRFTNAALGSVNISPLWANSLNFGDSLTFLSTSIVIS